MLNEPLVIIITAGQIRNWQRNRVWTAWRAADTFRAGDTRLCCEKPFSCTLALAVILPSRACSWISIPVGSETNDRYRRRSKWQPRLLPQGLLGNGGVWTRVCQRTWDIYNTLSVLRGRDIWFYLSLTRSFSCQKSWKFTSVIISGSLE